MAYSGPAGHCGPTDVNCQSYNYGYNSAVAYVRYSRMQGIDPKMWWLDVEGNSGWTTAASNDQVLAGLLGGLKTMHTETGIYSTRYQWNLITAGMSIPGEREWVPGVGNPAGPGYTATSACADPASYTFGGGRLELVQFGYRGPFPGSYTGPTTYDQDYASCN